MICGDLDGTGPGAEAWRKIPLSQARFALRPLLQARGLREVAVRVEPSRVVIELGPPVKVRAWRLEGPSGDFISHQSARRRRVIGELLTPALLDELESWVMARLRSEGYACPLVSSIADADQGWVILRADPGSLYFFSDPDEEETSGLATGVLRRYDAFIRGARFDHDLLTLTERRILSAGVVESAHFSVDCSQRDRPRLRQNIVSGPPRLVSFGFGTNAEGVFLVRGSWSHQRLGPAASSMRVAAIASFREQTLELQGVHYPATGGSRLRLMPGFSAQVRDEKYFSERTVGAKLEAASGSEFSRSALELSFGPSFEVHRKLRGQGPTQSRFLLAGAEIRFFSHEWELFRNSPKSGFTLTLGAAAASDRLGSDASVWRLRSSGEYLWNLKDFDPALLILSLRIGADTTWTPNQGGVERSLPPSFRQFLGGARTIRGFGRNELPGDERGGLSSLFGGLEARLLTLLPWSLEPFLFVDAGALARESFDWRTPTYWSPGIGFRWEGPAGSLRATLARGYVVGAPELNSQGDPLEHLQFYFSLGEEF